MQKVKSSFSPTRNGKPVARPARIKKSAPKLPWGALHGKMAGDFDAPLEEFKATKGMPAAVNMHEAKSSLSRLVKRAEAGEDVIIARNGKPVVRLTRIKESAPKLPWGIFKGKMWMADDFDAPLDEFKDYL